ncbi:MAG TPA: hypothetical protein VIO14_01020 [Dehalococcoidia bacterium]
MTATVTRTPRPDLAADAVELVIDCPHGETGGLLVGVPVEEEPRILAALLTQHDALEGPRGCRCTAALWVRVRASLSRN